MFPPNQHMQQDVDAPIRATDTDASLARLSAVRKNYLKDAFIKHFVPRAHLQPIRPPLINIGTYVRSESIDMLVEGWIRLSAATGQKCQIISLGAGSDTRFWRLAAGKYAENIRRYVETDFAEVTSRKAMLIRKSAELSAILGENTTVEKGGTAMHSDVYHLIPIDLRLPPHESFESAFFSQNDNEPALLETGLPTLLLCECVLAYINPETSSAMFDWFVKKFSMNAPLGAIVYEMFGLEDSFGKVMKSNLKTRNVELPGVEAFTSFELLPHRFTRHGFTTARALTLRQIRSEIIPKGELERISKLEMLDEIEELELVLAHYAVTWGVKLPDAAHTAFELNNRLGWEYWGLYPSKSEVDEQSE